MNLEKRIIAFVKLGEVFKKSSDETLMQAVQKTSIHNNWFTEENILLSLRALGEMLKEEKIRKWLDSYPKLKTQKSKSRSIGVIIAGNIPLVGFHDFMSVLISGNVFVGKLSSDDKFLLPASAKILTDIEPGFGDKINFIDQPFKKFAGVSAYIATGSNNSSRYFEYYFKKYSHIVRKNRNAIAVLDGTESKNDLQNLGKDIFQYFGLGCRNVSKIYIPENYNLDTLFESIVDFSDVINHNKYANNYSYYRTIYLMNSEKFLDNNFLLVKESSHIASPVATLYYERYKNKQELHEKIEEQKENIQCVVSNLPMLAGLQSISFGQTQSPELWNYADGIDTMEFLLN